VSDNVKVRLVDVAHARSGDKGDTANVGLIAYEERWFLFLQRYVTRDAVARHFGTNIDGPVERFELPNLWALNFLLHGALDGGGTLSLKTDAQGKTHGQGLLMMEIEVPAELIPTEHGVRVPRTGMFGRGPRTEP
jgi:hypothetical protein